MRVRRRTLPEGWYPSRPEEVMSRLAEWKSEFPPPSRPSAAAGLAPHAGWFFSGSYAFRAISALRPAETVVILGGHLGRNDPVLVQDFDGFETPLGPLNADRALMDGVKKEVSPFPDESADNTVEIQLPLVKAILPNCSVACFRVPPSELAVKLGRFFASLHRSGHEFVLLASTDLTHYGPNYGFMPKGTGTEALEWVRKVNDAAFLDAVLSCNAGAILETGEKGRAACSSGAAAALAVFAAELGLAPELLGYGTSYDRHPASSFVGYGALVFR